MSDVHPYPQDITADPFIVYGGLFSRKVIFQKLQSIEATHPQLFSQFVQLSDQCADEIPLQNGIEKAFNENYETKFLGCKKPDGITCDRFLGDDWLIEIKSDKQRFDPQFWQGSKVGENAVQQTRGYLDSSVNRDWAILTNGKIIRIMNKNTSFNFVDFWICDSDKSGKTKQAALLIKILTDKIFREELLAETKSERSKFTQVFEAKVSQFWNTFKSEKDRNHNVSLVECILVTALGRFLEDCGILPILNSDYSNFRFSKPKTVEELLEKVRVLRSQRFLGNSKDKIDGILSIESIERIEKVLLKESVFSEFCGIFWDNEKEIDLSDLKISFFGDAYQVFANKTDINGVDGQYFTGSDLAKEAAMYFVEEEKKGVASDEIIFDPFVGSGQLLRALVPFFHVLMQGEVREPSIIGGMRDFAKRLAGTDIDPHACWLARLSLAIATAESGKGLLDLSNNIREADVFKTCFGYTESKWQEKLGVTGKIRGIVSNPPWRRLRQTTNELYSIETGNPAPVRANKENWGKYQRWLVAGGKKRAGIKADELKKLSKIHKETFKRCGQKEVNVALSGLDFIDRIPGTELKKWVVFMPDVFFVGANKLRNAKDFNLRRYYSYPYNDHFKETDSVMKFGIVFGGGSKSPKLICHPMGTCEVNVKDIFQKLKVLPIFSSAEEAWTQAIWFSKSVETESWGRGEFDESEAPKKGARSISSGGVPVRGAKKCNDKKTHSCIVNKDSISRWSNWNSPQNNGWRVLVRDKRSNTRDQKILWVGIHKPGKMGIPQNCAISNAWNFLSLDEKSAKAVMKLLNTPIADTAMRSIGSKRNINPKDLNKLGLPKLSKEMIETINLADQFEEYTALILMGVFELSKADAEKILAACAWISKKEKEGILSLFSLQSKSEAAKLQKTRTVRRGQVKKAGKKLGVRSRRTG